jgi:Signal transduction histidine kinase
MNHLINKIIIFLCCCVFSISNLGLADIVIPIILIITFSSLSSFFSKQVMSLTFMFLFLLFSTFFQSGLFFIPLICYDIFLDDFQFLVGTSILPFLINYKSLSNYVLALIIILGLISFILKKQAIELNAANSRYEAFREKAEEISISLELKNKELMEKQDYEVNLATLNERNRIAREIHDNIGHTLSSSLLQIGALITISKDTSVVTNLTLLKDTLANGMNNIRHSIHNIHEESMDLNTTLQSLINDFSFCSATLSYNIKNDFTIKAKYSIVYIVKEALSNTMKHSNATDVNVELTEQPGFYQLIIKDNGVATTKQNTASGMGITSITNRVTTLDGTLRISRENGYILFISLPKRRTRN